MTIIFEMSQNATKLDTHTILEWTIVQRMQLPHNMTAHYQQWPIMNMFEMHSFKFYFSASFISWIGLMMIKMWRS